jgi:hypothetical protein
MPKIAEGDANKVWVVPSEITRALEGLGSAVHQVAGIPQHTGGPRTRVDLGSSEPVEQLSDKTLSGANEAVREAIAAADEAAGSPIGGPRAGQRSTERDAAGNAPAATSDAPAAADAPAEEPPVP